MKFTVAAAPKCNRCGKSVYADEMIKAAGQTYHKSCFQCQEDGCPIKLTLANHKAFEGKIFCAKHLPKPKATTVADSVMTQHALNAPKKAKEGLATVHKAREKSTIVSEVDESGNKIEFRPKAKVQQQAEQEVEEQVVEEEEEEVAPKPKPAPAKSAPAPAKSAPAPAKKAPEPEPEPEEVVEEEVVEEVVEEVEEEVVQEEVEEVVEEEVEEVVEEEVEEVVEEVEEEVEEEEE